MRTLKIAVLALILLTIQTHAGWFDDWGSALRANLKKETPAADQPVEAVRELEMVSIPGKSYEMGKYEVTQGQWKQVMGSNPSRFSKCGDNCPVELVSWSDAQEFIQKLNAQTGNRYRLPTEAEWEYACYGGIRSAYCGGDSLNAVAWHKGNSNDQTHPGGQKQANGYGLYDMTGNVWEWTQDCYDRSCSGRVVRGSAWNNGPQVAHAAYRDRFDEDDQSSLTGFRLARTLQSPAEAAQAQQRQERQQAEAAQAVVSGLIRIPGKKYEIGKYEVTQGQWKAMMGRNPSYFKKCGDSCPVERVSWNDAQEFIQKLNAQTGKQYRLPTQAEWEFACYGGSQTEYCGGDKLDTVGWHKGNSNDMIHPVGQKQANGYGLYDMTGNVGEWTNDCPDGNCAKRVFRGGSYEFDPQSARADLISWEGAAERLSFVGFRLARTLR